MNEPVRMTEIERTMRGWIDDHCRSYLESGGTKGHIMDLSGTGGLPFTTCLLLKTIGRKSKSVKYSPLIYGDTGGEVVIIASRGGADIHPAWYFNLTAAKTVEFQIASEAFRAKWREAEGAERADIWKFMEKLYPPFKDYQKATQRKIPVVVMKAQERIAAFK